MIRILHIIGVMDRGGAETFVMNLLQSIDRTQYMFDFLVHQPHEGAFEPLIEQLGGRIYRIPYVPEAGHNGYMRALCGFFAEHAEYRIVHSHMDRMSGLVLQQAKRAGVPFCIAHGHALAASGGWAGRLYKWFIGRRISRFADLLLAPSYQSAKWTFGSAAKRAQIIPNAIDTKVFAYDEAMRSKMRERLEIADRFVVGHVARLEPVKNHAFLLEAFAEVCKRRPDAVLLLMGDGTQRTVLQARAVQLGIPDAVRFLGVRQDIVQLLQAVDLFVLPSLSEGLGIAAVEAQAAGLPCLLSTGVPTEADICESLVTRLPLEVDRWAEAMVREYARWPDAWKQVKERGYDLQDVAVSSQKLYQSG